MKTNSRKLISTVLTMAMVFSLFAFIPPPTASAATGLATINVGTFGIANDSNSGSSSQSQWTYNGTT